MADKGWRVAVASSDNVVSIFRFDTRAAARAYARRMRSNIFLKGWSATAYNWYTGVA